MTPSPEIKREQIWATVVTHNRIALLQQCIEALRQQSYRIDGIIVINNESTDGTQEWLNAQDDIIAVTQSNTGSAGGQYRAFKEAYERGADWIWTMDDDVVPSPSALEELIKAKEITREDNPAYFCSLVISSQEDVLMNVPILAKTPRMKGYDPQWPKYLPHGIVELSEADFVGVLVNRKAIRKVGYPIKELFIWGDDREFTARLYKYGPGYIVGRSQVTHYRATAKSLSISAEPDKKRRALLYYRYRNLVYRIRKKRKGPVQQLGTLLVVIAKTILEFIRNRCFFNAMPIFIKGIMGGLFFNPKAEIPKDSPRL